MTACQRGLEEEEEETRKQKQAKEETIMDKMKQQHRKHTEMHTLRSLSSLLGDFFREFWRGILGGVRDYLGGGWGRFLAENWRKIIGKTRKTIQKKSGKFLLLL